MTLGKAWSKVTLSERRQMGTGFVRKQEGETRRAAVAGNVEERKISWRELWAMDANLIK